MEAELLEKILDDMNFIIIVWEKINNKKRCIFTNCKNNLVNVGDSFYSYIKKYKNLKGIYNKLFSTNKDQFLIVKNHKIK